MSGAVPVIPKMTFTDSTGAPLALGQVSVYQAGTSTPVTTYQDSALTIPNSFPIVLDSQGRCLLWVSSTQTYKIVVNDSTGALQYSVDNVMPSANGSLAITTTDLNNRTGTDGTLSFRNRLHNGGFRVNQRAVAGTVTLAAGAYGHDRWKAGAGGCTYTFATSGNVTVLTITAGSLMQVVEDVNVEGGVYSLSNQGTALARIAVNGASTSGSYAAATSAAPLQSPNATGGQTITVEFSTGTLDRVQLEPGTVATVFERRPISVELDLCRRYARPWGGAAKGVWVNATSVRLSEPIDVNLRTTPSYTVTNSAPRVENWQIGTFTGSGSTITATGTLGTTWVDVTVNGFTGGPVTTPLSPAFSQQDFIFVSADL